MFSCVTAIRFLSLAGSHSTPHLPKMPSNSMLISGLAVGAAQILIWSYSCVFLPPISTAIRIIEFSFVGDISILLCIPWTQSLPSWSSGFKILSWYSWWEGFGSSSLATVSLGFNCGFISTSACGSFTGVHSWGCPGGLGSAPVRARWYSCLDPRGSVSSRYSREFTVRTAGNIVL